MFAFLPTNPIADSPYFHPHSFVEFSLRCQLGVLNLERVLPSRSRTGYRCFQRPRSWRVSQSPELGDWVKPCQAAFFFRSCRKL